jgi:uncharacterized LabA/DUF88 family protein
MVSATYYIGAIKTDGTEKTQKLFDDQRKLLAHLKESNINYSLGYLLKSDDKFHEKGVDIKMAVDILTTSFEKLADKIILVSSDTDLLPAVKKAKSKGVAVEYIGFSHMPSQAMKTNSTRYRLLSRKDLKPMLS